MSVVAPSPGRLDAVSPLLAEASSLARPGGNPLRRRRVRRTVFLNGKFYSGVLNGVHRTADRLIRQLDELSAAGECPDLEFRLLLPKRRNWAPEFSHIRKTPQGLGHHQIWEQAILPFAAGNGLLVNLANLAPVLHPRKLYMLHDAQFLISPESFPLKFSLGYRMLTPLIAATSAKVLTVSEYARDSLAAFKVSPHRKTHVIYNGADHMTGVLPDHRILLRHGLQARSFALLFGTPAAYKNIQVVLEAFRASTAGLQLVIIGCDRGALHAAGLEPPRHAIFAGAVSDPELRALYEKAECFLFPSRTEGFGLPPVEAMSCGCPVVAAPAGAIPEICRDAVLYADVFSPEAWAKQIYELQQNPMLRRSKIAAGLNRSADFTWSKSGRRLLDHIEALA